MKIRPIVGILLFIISFTSAQSTIHTINSITEATSLIGSYTDKALILLDIDDTLMIAVDKIMRNANLVQHGQLMEVLKQQPNGNQLIDTVFQTAEYQLVEEQFVPLIETWKPHVIAIFGCTARRTGKFILESTVEDWVVKRLTQLGIHFTKFDSSLPNFKYGILFCHTMPKGIALLELLPELSQDIKTIIMIDDRQDHLESISRAVAQWNDKYAKNIHYLGFHYKAADYLDNNLDMKLVERQLAHLINHGTYISEVAAAA